MNLDGEAKTFGLSEHIYVKAPGDILASEGELTEVSFRELYRWVVVQRAIFCVCCQLNYMN